MDKGSEGALILECSYILRESEGQNSESLVAREFEDESGGS